MAGLIILLLLLLVTPASSQTSLPVQERIQAQEKIEKVYYNHRIWPNKSAKPPFEELVPPNVIEKKVIDSLKKSEVLSITPKMLQAEMNRIAKTTKDPAMLQELFLTLNNDPYLIAETLMRPILAERMSQDKNFVRAKKRVPKFSFTLPEINGGSSCEGWEVLNAPNPPSPRSGHTAVWTGTEMIIWGGADQNTGARYDPSLNTWTQTSTGANVPTARSDHSAIWTGTEMIVWGGSESGTETNTGGRYDPVTDSWSPTSIGPNVPEERVSHSAVWTGSEMIIWGGTGLCCSGGAKQTGGRYDPSTNSWQPTSVVNVPTGRTHHSTIWTGQEMIIWGGSDDFFSLQSGGRYNPDSDTWLPTSFDNAPSLRFNHTAVWTGSEMIIWGGNFNEVYESGTNSGSRYDPIPDTWQPTPTFGAPLQRGEHIAVWTGTEMIVWSGNFFGWNMKIGGRYSPLNNNWAGTAIGPNAPEGRSEPTAIWTGTKMIVWGGYNATGDLNTGGIYSPDTDYIALNPVGLPNAEVGTPYFQTISASGGASPYSMQIVEGSLSWFKPDFPEPSVGSLKFDGSTGVLSGTPAQFNFAQFAVTATDANSCAGSQSYYFYVCPVITFSPLELPPGAVGLIYNQTIVPSGGLEPYLFTITAGSLPPGLSLDSYTGLISGTPTTLGSFSLTIRAVDLFTCAKSKDYTIKVNTISPHN